MTGSHAIDAKRLDNEMSTQGTNIHYSCEECHLIRSRSPNLSNHCKPRAWQLGFLGVHPVPLTLTSCTLRLLECLTSQRFHKYTTDRIGVYPCDRDLEVQFSQIVVLASIKFRLATLTACHPAGAKAMWLGCRDFLPLTSPVTVLSRGVSR